MVERLIVIGGVAAGIVGASGKQKGGDRRDERAFWHSHPWLRAISFNKGAATGSLWQSSWALLYL